MPQLQQFTAKSAEASNLRRRKYQLIRQFRLPEDLVGGSLSHTQRRCGRSNCHCAGGRGHPQCLITFSRGGNRRVERVPREWVEDLERAALQTQAYLDAIREVMEINLDLLAQTRREQQIKKVRGRKKIVRSSATNDQHSSAAIDH